MAKREEGSWLPGIYSKSSANPSNSFMNKAYNYPSHSVSSSMSGYGELFGKLLISPLTNT